MKINWTVRFKNKTWLITFFAAIVAFIYQILGIVGIVPVVSQDMVTQLIALVINILVATGIVIDPTTSGIADSKTALKYTEPKNER